MPLATVLIPMRNAEAYVDAALASILAETEVDLEVLVVDDGSADASRQRVRERGDARIRLIDGPRQGIAACLNAGLAAARGEFLMRCDADDLYPPGRIRRQVEWLRRHPGHVAVCGAFSTIDAADRLVADLGAACGGEAADIDAELRAAQTRTHLGTFAVRASAIRASGGFRPYFESGEDLDFQFRLAEQGKIRYLPEIAYLYRLHGESLTHSQSDRRRVFFEDMARLFCRQRRRRGVDDLDRGDPPAPPARRRAAPGDVRDQIQGMLLSRAWRLHALGERRRAAAVGVRALSVKPLCLGVWKSFALLLFK